jgi:hypothetical protein
MHAVLRGGDNHLGTHIEESAVELNPFKLGQKIVGSLFNDGLPGLSGLAGKNAPMNLFQGDTLNVGRGGSGLFPTRAGGSGGIDELLARMSKKDKNSSFDTSGVGDNLFRSGTKAVGELASSALSAATQGASQAMGAIMGILKQILPIVLGFL